MLLLKDLFGSKWIRSVLRFINELSRIMFVKLFLRQIFCINRIQHIINIRVCPLDLNIRRASRPLPLLLGLQNLFCKHINIIYQRLNTASLRQTSPWALDSLRWYRPYLGLLSSIILLCFIDTVEVIVVLRPSSVGSLWWRDWSTAAIVLPSLFLMLLHLLIIINHLYQLTSFDIYHHFFLIVYIIAFCRYLFYQIMLLFLLHHICGVCFLFFFFVARK